MIILAYILTVLDYVLYCLSRFMKQKAAILALDLVAKICTATALYCLSSLSGAYIYLITIPMLITANIKERLHKEWLCGYIAFQTLYIVVLYTTYAGISSLLVVLAASIKLLSVWFLSPQKMRLLDALNSLTFLSFQISIRNWAGLLEVGAFLSNVISFIKYKKKRPSKR